MTCGIYMIQNLVNFKIYIGQSIDIENRWRGHINAFNSGKGINKHFQNSWNKYGEENFEFSIICECDESQLNTMEEYYIFELMTYDTRFGYNKNYGGNGLGTIQEIKDILSEKSKQCWSNDEYRNNMINKVRDMWTDPEYRKKQYEGNLLVHKYEGATSCVCINNGNIYKSIGDIYEELGRNKGDTSIYTNVRLNSKFEESQFETFKFHSFKGNYYIGYDVWDSLSSECRNYLQSNIDSLNKNRMSIREKKEFEEKVRRIKEEKLRLRNAEKEQRKINLLNNIKYSKSQSKPIVQIDINTMKPVKYWKSANELRSQNLYDRSTVLYICKGRGRTHKGYKWMYLSEYMDKYCGIIE